MFGYCLVPESPPGNLGVDNTIPQQLTYEWTELPEEDRNGIIHYEYSLSEDVVNMLEEGSTNLTSITFMELPHYTEYAFRVRATTSVGEGPWSATVRTTTRAIGWYLNLMNLLFMNARLRRVVDYYFTDCSWGKYFFYIKGGKEKK